MNRWLRAGIVLAAVLVLPRLPNPAVDIGKLDPAAVVWIAQTEEGVWMLTDTGASGAGATLDEAMSDLQSGHPVEVFLESTDYLLIDGSGAVPTGLETYFRPGCRVCLAEGVLNLEEAAGYLTLHKPERTLTDLRAGKELEQMLKMVEGKWQIE